MPKNNPNAEKNLKKWKPGETGNPNGRPKKLPGLEELLTEALGEEIQNMSAMKAIILRLRQLAIKGDLRAIQLLLDRTYGKAKEHIDITTGGQPITRITYTVRRAKP